MVCAYYGVYVEVRGHLREVSLSLLHFGRFGESNSSGEELRLAEPLYRLWSSFFALWYFTCKPRLLHP